MTYEQKAERIKRLELKIFYLREKMFKYIGKNQPFPDMNKCINQINRTYCTINQLRQRYGIYNNSILI